MNQKATMKSEAKRLLAQRKQKATENHILEPQITEKYRSLYTVI